MDKEKIEMHIDAILKRREELKKVREKNKAGKGPGMTPIFQPMLQYEMLLFDLAEKEDLKVPTLHLTKDGVNFYTLKDFIRDMYYKGFYDGENETKEIIKKRLGI
jgi:hypothetical protein